MSINDKNLYDKGMFICLSLGAWQARSKLNKSQLKGFTDKEREIVRGVHDLLYDTSELDAITSFNSKTKITFDNMTIPTPMRGIRFCLGTQIEKTLEYVKDRKQEREEIVQTFLDAYESRQKEFEKEMPEYHKLNKHKYPTKDDLKSRFYINVRVFKVSVPDKGLKYISPELYKQEVNAFKQQVEDMKKEVVNIIYTELLDKVNNLKTQCLSGKPSQKTFNFIEKFMERIADNYDDFIERNDIRSMIDKVKSEVGSVEAKELRDNESLKKEFGKQMKGLLSELQNLPDVELKRAIEL